MVESKVFKVGAKPEFVSAKPLSIMVIWGARVGLPGLSLDSQAVNEMMSSAVLIIELHTLERTDH